MIGSPTSWSNLVANLGSWMIAQTVSMLSTFDTDVFDISVFDASGWNNA